MGNLCFLCRKEEEYLGDPGAREACVFSLKENFAYKGDSTANPGKKWMYIIKSGDEIQIANMKPAREMLWSACIDGKPKYQEHLKSSGGFANLFLPEFLLEGFGQMQEPEDRVYFEKAGREFQDGLWAISKFSLQTSFTLSPGSRGEDFGPFQLFIFVRGTSICDYDRDPEHSNWKKTPASYVDAVCYNLVQLNSGENIASWWVPGDLDPSKGEQQNKICRILADWNHTKSPIIRTNEGWDPVFALLLGYLCASEFSPQHLKEHYLEKPNFPDRPPNASFF